MPRSSRCWRSESETSAVIAPSIALLPHEEWQDLTTLGSGKVNGYEHREQDFAAASRDRMPTSSATPYPNVAGVGAHHLAVTGWQVLDLDWPSVAGCRFTFWTW